MSWELPKRINGNFEKFIITAKKMPNPTHRNYCDNPFRNDNKYGGNTEVKTPSPTSDQKQNELAECDCVKCLKTCEKKETDGHDEREAAIDFEDEIQNFVWRKQTDDEDVSELYNEIQRKAKRQIQEFPDNENENNVKSRKDSKESFENKMNEFNEYIVFYDTISNIENTSYNLHNLEHYSQYQISIQICRERINSSEEDSSGDNGDACSSDTSITIVTPEKPENDLIPWINVQSLPSNHSKSYGAIRVQWSPPKRPNGAVLAYNIIYRKVDNEHAKHAELCITPEKTPEKSYLIDKLASGNYSVQVAVTSMAGISNFTTPEYGTIPESSNSNYEIIIALLVVVLVAILIGGVWYFLRRHSNNISNIKLIANVNPDYAGINYKQDEWEVPRDKVLMLQELGQGSFGMVYEGIVKDLKRKGTEELLSQTRCAIKTVNEQATDKERASFLMEASVMKQFDTTYVVKLLGVVSISQPTFVVMELMPNGDLKGYLRSHRAEYNDDASQPPPQPPTIRQMLQMSAEIADGMSYLAAKKYVHRDLAARNCMVADDLSVKIGDFGMTRDIYETDYYRY